MNIEDLLTNELRVRFDENREVLRIHAVDSGVESDHSIDIKLSTFLDLGAEESAKFLGERLLLLIPTTRKKLYGAE